MFYYSLKRPFYQGGEIFSAYPKLVKETGAKSTDLESPEDVNHLCSKCTAYASNWKPTADKLWEEEH